MFLFLFFFQPMYKIKKETSKSPQHQRFLEMLDFVTSVFVFVQFLTFDVHGYNLKPNLFGHRGGIRHLVPEHSIASYTIGAQNGATYVEPDLVFTKDGQLVVLHDIHLNDVTNIQSNSNRQYHNRSTSRWFWLRDYNYTSNETISTPLYNFRYETDESYFAFDFTLQELKQLKIRTQPSQSYNYKNDNNKYNETTPLDDIFDILTFNQTLELVLKLSDILGRTIGVIPECKKPLLFESLGYSCELRMLETLEYYGFVKYDSINKLYIPYTLYVLIYIINNNNRFVIYIFSCGCLRFILCNKNCDGCFFFCCIAI